MANVVLALLSTNPPPPPPPQFWGFGVFSINRDAVWGAGQVGVEG